ncbi:hypothetical protein niasHS_005683 [Heterodera schachtii]|uniref:Secreted protein n=2 Tax=Heterodera TaxID=34509 RepID=A0ABD2KBR1_9BILA
MFSVRFFAFLLLLAVLCCSLVECGLIGIGATPIEAAWCGVVGQESTHCPGGALHGGFPAAGGTYGFGR